LVPYDCNRLVDSATCPAIEEALCSSGTFLDPCDEPPLVGDVLACEEALEPLHPLPTGMDLCDLPDCHFCPGWCPE